MTPPRPRTSGWPVICSTSRRSGGDVTSSRVTWQGGDLAVEAVSTYVVRSVGRRLVTSLVSSALWQGLHRLTETRAWSPVPEGIGMKEGRGRAACLVGGGCRGGVGGGRRAHCKDVEGSVPVKRELRLQDGRVGALPDTLADSGSGVVDLGPAANGEMKGGEEGGHDGRDAAL